MVNCISAGNKYFLPGVADRPDEHPDRYDMPIKPEFILELQAQQVDLNVLNSGDYDENWICQSNLFGGVDSGNFIGRAGNAASQDKAQAACTFVHNNDYASIFVDAANKDFRPAGPALKVGENSDLVNGMLGAYTQDLAGKPRATDGKIYAGCYQP